MQPDLFGARPAGDPRRAAEIKEWVEEVFRLPGDASVMVTEVRCSEPGCPPLETVIAVLTAGAPPLRFKLPRPLAEVTFADVLRLAADARPPANHPEAHP